MWLQMAISRKATSFPPLLLTRKQLPLSQLMIDWSPTCTLMSLLPSCSGTTSIIPISSLIMKRFSFLLPGSKKPKPKSPATSPAAPPKPPPPLHSLTAAAGHDPELDLLLAQAEATLGELLARAGASFEVQSSSLSLPDRPSAAPSRPHSQIDDDMKSSLTSSGSRSAKFSCEGHGRKRSLSRVWQQLGGNLFCGSGQMSGYVMDQEMMAAAVPSTDVYDHDAVLNDSYWQSLAESILAQKQKQQHQQRQMDAKLAADDSVGLVLDGCEGIELCCCGTGKEQQVQNDEARGDREVRYAENLQQEVDRESEIVQLIDGEEDDPSGRSSLQDMDSMSYKSLVGAGSRGVGCTRLNTTLEESPNLAYNYLSLKVGMSAHSSSSNLMDPYRFPEANPRYEVGTGCNNSSNYMQPLERLLRETAAAQRARKLSGCPLSPASRSGPAFNWQDPTGLDLSDTSSCRVSLMTLLHKEAAAGDRTTATAEAMEEAEVVVDMAAAAGRAAGMQAGEDPLLCCVCMIRRKGAALIPCGHTFCRTCSKLLFTDRGACPLCNNLIVQVLDIF